MDRLASLLDRLYTQERRPSHSHCAHALLSPSHPLPNINQPARFGRAEFQAQVYPVLAALASYKRCLEQDLQKKLIK